MDPIKKFEEEKLERLDRQLQNKKLKKLADDFFLESVKAGYSYNFSWMGRPIIQYPQDMIAMQEIIWNIQPDLIIETGIAHGGSLIFYASLLELIGKGEILGIDIDIRAHNKKEIENHPMFKRIKILEGSSISNEIIDKVKVHAEGKKNILVVLDSNHTHDHVLKELELYSPFVSKGSYAIVFDTVVEDMPADYDWGSRPWGKGNSPKTAAEAFLKKNADFKVDESIDAKLIISVAPGGYLKRIS
ncbi:MAG: cephalosporin hydroxylase family protein [Chitinophagaceae bacterium]|nr:cephalosporin hydroxylase family protein [Chitinophagaceae bacterium]